MEFTAGFASEGQWIRTMAALTAFDLRPIRARIPFLAHLAFSDRDYLVHRRPSASASFGSDGMVVTFQLGDWHFGFGQRSGFFRFLRGHSYPHFEHFKTVTVFVTTGMSGYYDERLIMSRTILRNICLVFNGSV